MREVFISLFLKLIDSLWGPVVYSFVMLLAGYGLGQLIPGTLIMRAAWGASVFGLLSILSVALNVLCLYLGVTKGWGNLVFLYGLSLSCIAICFCLGLLFVTRHAWSLDEGVRRFAVPMLNLGMVTLAIALLGANGKAIVDWFKDPLGPIVTTRIHRLRDEGVSAAKSSDFGRINQQVQKVESAWLGVGDEAARDRSTLMMDFLKYAAQVALQRGSEDTVIGVWDLLKSDKVAHVIDAGWSGTSAKLRRELCNEYLHASLKRGSPKVLSYIKENQKEVGPAEPIEWNIVLYLALEKPSLAKAAKDYGFIDAKDVSRMVEGLKLRPAGSDYPDSYNDDLANPQIPKALQALIADGLLVHRPSSAWLNRVRIQLDEDSKKAANTHSYGDSLAVARESLALLLNLSK